MSLEMKIIMRLFLIGLILSQVVLVAGAIETNASPLQISPALFLSPEPAVATPATPPFTGKNLGLPPKQNAAWLPPEALLPTNNVTAATLLFEQGLADPRGCDYREIEVGTGNVWHGDGGVVKTHGWVLPGRGETRFGIGWNGLVYPLVSIGTNASLEADVRLLPTNWRGTSDFVWPEYMGVAWNHPSGIHGCLLLRLGRVDLVSNDWVSAARPSGDNGNLTGGVFRPGQTRSSSTAVEREWISRQPGQTPATSEWDDPYYKWATEWAWSLFDRLICAHERGDENLALADARRLTQIQPLIESACARRGFAPEPSWDASGQKPRLQPYLSFLGQLPQILADLERRESEGRRVAVISRGLTNITDQAHRVRALIKDLDLIQARQWGEPGGVNPAEEPVVAALIAEGDAAVEPLLDCVEQDQRLTRSVSFGRSFHRGRTVLSVREAAWVALTTILQANFSSSQEMRAYWIKYKSLKIEDRWFAILADDSMRVRWPEAAANIVQPENALCHLNGFSMQPPVPTNSVVRLRGEPLRDRRNPSVAELMARHALEVTNPVESYNLSVGCQMAEYLAKWDVPAALPVARTLSKRASTVMKYSNLQLGDDLAKLALVRAQAGDPSAFEEFAGWILTTSPGQFERFHLDCFEPMKQFATNPVLQATAEKLFGQTNSAWGALPWTNNFGWPAVEAGLLAMHGYRQLLCRELLSTNVFGSVRLARADYLEYSRVNPAQSGGLGVKLPPTCQATNGSTGTIRWGDWLALALSTIQTNTAFDPFAATELRDARIQQLTTQLSDPR